MSDNWPRLDLKMAKNWYIVEKYIEKYTWIFLSFHLKNDAQDVILKISNSTLRVYKR